MLWCISTSNIKGILNNIKHWHEINILIYKKAYMVQNIQLFILCIRRKWNYNKKGNQFLIVRTCPKSKMAILFRPVGFIGPKHLFGNSIFRFSGYLKKVILEMRHVHYLWYLRFDFIKETFWLIHINLKYSNNVVAYLLLIYES